MMFFKATPRERPLRFSSLAVFAGALLVSLCLAGLLLHIQGKDGLKGVLLLLKGGFGHAYSWEDTLKKAVPIFLCSLGVSFCFRLQVWNIGAEGQYILGALGGSWFVLSFPGLALTTLGTGLANYLGTPFVGKLADGFQAFSVPFLSDLPFVGPILFRQDALVYLVFFIPPLLWYFLQRTTAGVGIPASFLHMLPYLLTLAVLFLSVRGGKRGGAPKALGVNLEPEP